jgi:hypothetical protein
MRLGQLARKLSIRSSEIVEFLQTQGVILEDSSNIRVPDQHLSRIIGKFAPNLAADAMTELAAEPETNELPLTTEVVSEPAVEPTAEELTTEESKSDVSEVIKAQKVELPGLKVIGKIDLPEPKKKDPPVVDSTSESQPAKPDRQDKGQRPDRRKAVQKNPIAKLRERDEEDMLRKREEAAKQKKELKARHYQKQIKPAAPFKKMRLVEEPVTELSSADLNPPRTLIGKFFRWLRT